MRKAALAAAGVLFAVSAAGVGVAAAAGHADTDPAAERAEEASFTQAHRAEAKVGEPQAVRKALDRHPGQVIDVHLQDEGDGLRWEVKPDDGRQVWEVQIDAQSGAIVSDQTDD